MKVYYAENDLYPATYNFRDEAVGASGTDIGWIDTESGTDTGYSAVITASEDGHRKVIKCITNGDNGTYVYWRHTITETSGTLELCFKYIDKGIGFHNFIFKNELGTDVMYSLLTAATNLYTMYYGDGAGGNNTITVAMVSDTWNHIRFMFDCATDKQTVWVNGILKVDAENFHSDRVATSISNYRFQFDNFGGANSGEAYIDAIGESWDTDYAIGDNLKGELFQCWNVKPKKHVDAINWVMLLGGIVDGVQISAESKDQNSIDELGAKIYKDTYAIITVAAQLLIAANNLRTREQLLPLAINLWSHETNRGLIQVGECVWVAHAQGNPNISPRQVILNKVIYRFLSGHVNLQTSDGISFVKNRDESLSQENSQLIQQNATEIEVVDDKVDALSIPTIDLLAWGTLTAMTNDGAYYDIDLSGTYGANILGVMIYITTLDADITESVILRPKASTYTVIHNHNIANLSCTGTYFVHTNSDGIFQYRAMAGLTSAYYRILMVIKE